MTEQAVDLRSSQVPEALKLTQTSRSDQLQLRPIPEFNIVTNYQDYRRIRNILAWGEIGERSGKPINDVFNFHLESDGRHYHDKHKIKAQSSGIEGFLFTEDKIRAEYGAQELLHLLPDYLRYLQAISLGTPEFDRLVESLENISVTYESLSYIERKGERALMIYEQLISYATEYSNQLKASLKSFDDQSLWVKKDVIYQIYPRDYNLRGRRSDSNNTEMRPFFEEFKASDLYLITDVTYAEAVWFNGIFSKGSPFIYDGQLVYGWSPYAVKDYLSLQPEFGTISDFHRTVDIIKQNDLKLIGDFIFNHTARDAKWLLEDPTLYVHQLAQPGQAVPNGYFKYVHNGQDYFIAMGRYRVDDLEKAPDGYLYFLDTAQLDLYNPKTQQKIIDTALAMIELYHFDGARVDMSYSLTRECFARLFKAELASKNQDLHSTPCFLGKLISAIKSKYPNFGVIAESYWGYETLSIAGCDVIYGKNYMPTNGTTPHGKHAGFYDPLVEQNGEAIWSCLQKLEFLRNSVGCAEMMTFSGNHDEPELSRALNGHKDRWPGVVFFSTLLPGSKLICAGQEVKFDISDSQREQLPRLANGRLQEPDKKPLPFSGNFQVDWQSNGAALHYQKLLNRLLKKIIASEHTFIVAAEQRHAGHYRPAAYILSNSESVKDARWHVIYNTNGETKFYTACASDGTELPISISPGECVLIDLNEKRYHSSKELYAQAVAESSKT